jgi:hypothetical protein
MENNGRMGASQFYKQSIIARTTILAAGSVPYDNSNFESSFLGELGRLLIRENDQQVNF